MHVHTYAMGLGQTDHEWLIKLYGSLWVFYWK